MGLIKTLKHIKTINSIVDKIDNFKSEKLDDILEAIYKLNVAICHLEALIIKAREGLTKLADKLNKLHPAPTPVEEVVNTTEEKAVE